MVEQMIVKSILNMFSKQNSMVGGVKQPLPANRPISIFALLFTLLIILLIKGYIVYLLYNMLIPELIYSFSKDKSLEEIEDEFKPISYINAVMLVIFCNALFHF